MRGIESPFRELNCVWHTPSVIGPPADQEIHLWSGSLDSTAAQRSGWQRLLSAEERQRAEQFHSLFLKLPGTLNVVIRTVAC